jgi:hypothetical protein
MGLAALAPPEKFPWNVEFITRAVSSPTHPCQGHQAGIQSLRNQFLTLGQALRTIKPQNACSSLTDRRHRLNARVRKSEMFGPRIGAWIIKAGEAAISQDRADIRAFLPIAENARQSQIIKLRDASMFDTNDVVNLMGEKAIILVRQAILAQSIRPRPHEMSQFVANEAAHGATAALPVLLPAA